MKKFYKNTIALVLAATAFSTAVNAQIFTNNNGAKLNIASGTYLNIDGTFENQSNADVINADIENNGTMEVSEGWTNNDAQGVFSTNAGTVRLDGSAQTIGGTNTTFFNNLTLAGGSSSVKTLAINTLVGGGYGSPAGVLTLETSGIGHTLDLNAKEVEITNPLNSAIVAGTGKIRSETTPSVTLNGAPGPGYGKVVWDIGTAGNGSVYSVPFANAAGNDITFLYEKTSAGVGAAGKIKFSTYHTATDNTPWATTVTGLVNEYNQPSHLYVVDRFWNIEHEGYTSGTANMPHSKYTFKYDDADLNLVGNTGIDNEAQLRPQRFNQYLPPNGGWGDWLFGPDVINPATNTLQISIANDYGVGTWMGGDYLPIWTLVDESNPLPIELIRFAGNCADGQVEVTWTTASETNNDFFTVQRSIDGVTFEDVTIVDGAGNSSSIINYSAVDYNPYGGTSYYRLKQTDFDGTSQYSDVVAVSCGNAATDFNLVNAYDQGNGTMAVIFNAGDNELYTVTLYDIIGKQITETTGKAYSGQNQINIAVGDLARGIYMINLKNEFKSFGRRVMLH
ncbi:MAG: hypothetical protein POELPBGB_00197 [Bacteroidia bacterium]|nr:hypothetical protein [Bacteroidia bacterium]